MDSPDPDIHLSGMWLLLRGLALTILLLNAVSCAGTDPSEFGGCTGLQLTIVRTAVVEFQWEPAGCAVYSLSIANGTLSDSGWYVESLGNSNQIESPVRYGVTPPGTQASPAEVLHGGPYRLIVTRLGGSGFGIVADTSFNAP
jgi:hypothetical protein